MTGLARTPAVAIRDEHPALLPVRRTSLENELRADAKGAPDALIDQYGLLSGQVCLFETFLLVQQIVDADVHLDVVGWKPLVDETEAVKRRFECIG